VFIDPARDCSVMLTPAVPERRIANQLDVIEE